MADSKTKEMSCLNLCIKCSKYVVIIASIVGSLIYIISKMCF